MKNRIVISAYNINTGGGLILLKELLSDLDQSTNLMLLLDSRTKSSVKTPAWCKSFYYAPTIIDRLTAEIKIHSELTSNDILLCFNNLPPLFGTKATTYVYLQNKYVISPLCLRIGSLKTTIRTYLEHLWFIYRKNTKITYIVQTTSMLEQFYQSIPQHFKCVILPFAPTIKTTISNINPTNSFIYVASGETHKNHKNLINAWKILKEKSLSPHLELILDTTKFQKLGSWIRGETNKFSLNISITDNFSQKDAPNIYSKHRALIFPSTLESFGLPLLEARMLGLDIIASEKDFVYHIANPKETFDPSSSESIARAVMRYMGITHKPSEIYRGNDVIRFITTT